MLSQRFQLSLVLQPSLSRCQMCEKILEPSSPRDIPVEYHQMTSVQGMKNRRITQLSPAQSSDPHISSFTLSRPLIPFQDSQPAGHLTNPSLNSPQSGCSAGRPPHSPPSSPTPRQTKPSSSHGTQARLSLGC